MRKPLEEVLQGAVGEKDIVLQGIAVIVYMNEHGQKRIAHRVSTDLRTWEARGLVGDAKDFWSAHEVLRMFEESRD